MEITIYRKRKNDLYTEGVLHINGGRQTYTVEATDVMLPEGEYIVRIVKKSARKQYISILKQNGYPTDWKIGIDHSFIGSKKNRIIAIGTQLIPGAIFKGAKHFERITDRLMKCMDREETITLCISEVNCLANQPISHWLEPANHGCPPSNRRVEPIDDRHYDIFDGDTFVKSIELPEKTKQ